MEDKLKTAVQTFMDSFEKALDESEEKETTMEENRELVEKLLYDLLSTAQQLTLDEVKSMYQEERK